MKKKDYLDLLKVALNGLPSEEIADIMRDQEEFIREAIAAGRNEEEVLQSLGNPIELARNLKAEIKIVKAQDEKHFVDKIKGVLSAVGAVLVLAPFNLIFVLGPLFALIGVLVGGWAAALSLLGVFIFLMVIFFGFAIFVPSSFLVYSTILFTSLGGVFFGLAAIGLMYFITLFFSHLILKYLKWNLNFIKKQTA